MSQPPPVRKHTRRGAYFYAIALLVMLSPVAYLWVSDREPKPAEAPLPAVAVAPSVAEVVGLTRELKLATVMVETVVRAKSSDPRWNGTASATIEARARHSFGVDLAQITQDSIRYSPQSGAYELTLPPPQRISIEIDLSHPQSESIQASGLRLRSLSGRDQLLRAQKSLYDTARNQALPDSLLAEVRNQSAQQIETLLSKLIDGHPVHVRFE
jgi:hypothetical protein